MSNRNLLALTASLVLASVVLAATPGGWAHFKPGAYSKLRTSSITETAGMTIETIVESKTTLKELSSTEATLDLETSTSTRMNGQENKYPPTTHTIKVPTTATASPAPGASPAAGPAPDTSEETVTVSGKAIKCTVEKTVNDIGGSKVSSKSWISDDVPGGLVKSETSGEGKAKSRSSTVLVEFDAKK